MEDVTRDIRRNREDQYFLKQEQRRMEEMRRQSEREVETIRLMEAFGIRDQDLVRELSDAGFDIDTFRVLYLVPLIQVAWSDGGVSPREREKVLEIAGLHGIKQGGAAHERLRAWLNERPPDRFFETCVRGIKAMIGDRPRLEAQALRRDLVWYCTRIASASGGFLGLGSRISREEEAMLKQLAAELDTRHHAAVVQVSRELGDLP
jgi:DnaJ-domain-containing protein 1